MKTIEQSINEILDSTDSSDYKKKRAIRLLAKKLDELQFEVSGIHEWKLQKEGI